MWRLLRQAPPELIFGARTTTPSENSTDEDASANWTIYWNATDFSQQKFAAFTTTTLLASSVTSFTHFEPFNTTLNDTFANNTNVTIAVTEPTPPREFSKIF